MYLGPAKTCGIGQLPHYEGHGYRLEPKIDGNWCLLQVKGSKAAFWSKQRNLISDNRNAEMTVPMLDPTELVGELKDQVLHLFDAVYLHGAPTVELPYGARRLLLEGFYERELSNFSAFTLLPAYTQSFRKVYDGIVDDGGEGVVLKHEESYYWSRRQDRKTSHWIKCKPEYGDYT